MRKFLGLLTVLLLIAAIAPAANAIPSFSYGNNELYYTNREAVFRNDGQGNFTELDYSGAPPALQVGDIFVGILNVQNIDNSITGTTHWFNSATDQLSGIFAQEITSIGANPNPADPLSVRIDLGVASANTFKTLAGDTFTTGLTGSEVLKMYYDDSTIFESNGSIVQDISVATDGNEWISLGMALTTDYGFTNISPQGTALDDFIGKSWLGLSVLNFVSPSTIFPNIIDPEVGVPVQFYANSELEGNDKYQSGLSPWPFESNDPAYANAIPEPTTMLLFGIGLLGISSIARRKNN